MPPTPARNKLFVSWSGATSKRVALVFKDYISEAFDGIEPFVSNRDVGAGTRSMEVIHDELRDSAAGLIIVTLQNQTAPWLNYEAGALGREVEHSKSRVIPILVDSPHLSDIQGPLAVFQAVGLDKDGLLKVFEALCDVTDQSRSRANAKLNTYLDRLTASVQEALTEGEASTPPRATRPSNDDKIDEILVAVRRLAGQAQDRPRMSIKIAAEQLVQFLEKNSIPGLVLVEADQLIVDGSDYRHHEAIYNAAMSIVTRGGISGLTFRNEEPPF